MNPTDLVDHASLRDDIPDFAPGDTLKVHVRVVEGNKERVQVFQGVVIRRQGAGVRETFTVRKVSYGVGVERTFPVHSPVLARIEVVTRGDVRRAKLYYLRDRVGKAAKIKEKRDATRSRLAADRTATVTAAPVGPHRPGSPFGRWRRRCACSRLPLLIVIALVVAFVLKAFVAQAFFIPSASMEPQLRSATGWSCRGSPTACTIRGGATSSCSTHPGRGPTTDGSAARAGRRATLLEGIGVRRPPETELIKRVVGLPGETVEGRDGRVFVDGRQLVEPYLPTSVVTSDFGPVAVPDGHVFVMGDNRGELAGQPGRSARCRATRSSGGRSRGSGRQADGRSCEPPVQRAAPTSDRRWAPRTSSSTRPSSSSSCTRSTRTSARCSPSSSRRSGASTSPTTCARSVHDGGGRTSIELELRDAWVWDMYRASRFVPSVRIVTFKDVNVEELPKKEICRADARDRRPASASGHRGEDAAAAWYEAHGYEVRGPQLAVPRRRARPGRAPRRGRSCSAR